jgi:hypothetical protein
MRFASVAVAALLLAILPACGRSSRGSPVTSVARTTRRDIGANVSVWGDSLMVQAGPALEAEGRARGIDVQVHAYFGLAPCDVTTGVLADVRSGIDAIVFDFSGNNLTPCMTRDGARLQGDAYYDTYRRDVGRLVSAARAQAVPVVVVGPPVFPDAQNRPDRVRLRSVLHGVADALGARYVDSAPALGLRTFTRTLPCLPDETAALGCAHGRITVRSGNGIHFDQPHRVPCANEEPTSCTYSAGSHRFADVVLDALARIASLHVAAALPGSGVPIVVAAS